MSVKKDSDYLIDIAAKHKYRNQSEEYQRRYLEWRTNPRNPYGYTFVHDTRVRTYVDGEGYLEETPVDSERTSLSNCYRLMGVTLLIMISVAFVRFLVMKMLFGVPNSGRTYYSELVTSEKGLPDSVAYSLMILNLLEYALPLLFLKASTRMPTKIAVPLRKSKSSTPNAIMMMLVIMAVGRVLNSVTAKLLLKIDMDIPYYDYIRADSPSAFVICGLVQHVVIGILIEIIFRGYLLQIFRQFGDGFAVIVTAIAGSFMLYDITQLGYMFCVGVFTGMLTIRSGSIKNACLMRIIARSFNFLVTFIASILGDFGSQMFDLVLCGLLLLSSLLVYIRINSRRRWSFEIGSTATSLTMSEKFRLMLLSPWLWMWFVASFVMSLFLIKLL
ncbi:MAG: CPBP family intramembrane metalloprotease [Ruminococcus sp.]|nr:CPBP family intramembrane metalloprotease [Ruminococcus sp.]